MMLLKRQQMPPVASHQVVGGSLSNTLHAVVGVPALEWPLFRRDLCPSHWHRWAGCLIPT